MNLKAVALATCHLLLATLALRADKPNILFIFADDMTYDAIAATGHPEVRTPNLDRLVREGTTFTHAYNPGSWSGAVCVASRTMLMTGRQLWHARKVYDDKKRMAEFVANDRLWPQLLAKAGYRTYMSGKWHVKADAAKVFDVATHVRPGMPRSVKEAYNRPLEGRPDPWDPADKSIGGFWEGGKHWSEVQADDAVGFLREAAGIDRPFFIYLAFNAPHDPRQAPREFLDMYPAEKVAVPESFQPRYPYCDEIGCPHGLRDEKLAPMPRTRRAVQVHRREYYAIISHMDAPIYLQDIIPTSLDWAGAGTPEHIQFRSLQPHLAGKGERRDAIYGAYLDKQRSITSGGYKLIMYPKAGVRRLYHVRNDPHELKDLLEDGGPQAGPLADALFAQFKVVREAYGDTLEIRK